MLNVMGRRFGRLIVLSDGPRRESRRTATCKCDCGNQLTVRLDCLTRGVTQSCGCLGIERVREATTTHGHARHGSTRSEYKTWQSLQQRCLNPQDKGYRRYGGRGITVCERWLGEGGYERFFADMGPKPSRRHSLDRYPDTNGPYSPENCRWATAKQQSNNRNCTTLLTLNGRTMGLCEWADELGVNRHGLRMRIRKGWTAEDALTTPFRKWGSNR